MCNDIKICIRRLCIGLFALIGVLLIAAGLGIQQSDDNIDDRVPYIMCGVGAVFIIVSCCICKCFPVIVVTQTGEYEYTSF